MKVFQVGDYDWFAAYTREQANELYFNMFGEYCDEDEIVELTEQQLDTRYQDYDEDERPISGKTFSMRELLAKNCNHPGWICGTE